MHEFHKSVYEVGGKIQKRDRFGIHAKIESLCIDALKHSVEAAFINRERRIEILHVLRIEVEMLKHLIRQEIELRIIKDNAYIALSIKLIEISKMTNGWIKFLDTKQPIN